MAFKLAEAYVQFSQRGLSGVQSMISSVGSGFSGATGLAGKFAAGLGAIGIGVSAGAMLKLAADAETAEVKFRVLLKSGDAAKKMIGEIDQFAAKTPFEKMEISQATQQLLAFGIPAGDVMTHLQHIGDISALTGNSINEMAEMYGKANVQGRLQMEDINQMTGRGIPIIQELAKQFGVAESDVRDLVSSGQVTAAHMNQAFHDMTTGSGQFADGMAQLSETTAGKFSTLKDNVTLILTQIGATMLPIANDLMASVSGFLEQHQTTITDSLSWVSETVGFIWNNIGDIWDIAVADLAINIYNMVEMISTMGLNVIETGEWMAENWWTILQDMANFTGTVLSNIGKNLSDFLAAVKSWLAGDGFNFQFTDLTQGFEAKTPELKLTAADIIETTPERDAAIQRIADREQAQIDKTAASKKKSDQEVATAEVATATATAKKKQSLQTGTLESIYAATRKSIWEADPMKPAGAAAGAPNAGLDKSNAMTTQVTKQTGIQEKMLDTMMKVHSELQVKNKPQPVVLG